MACRRLESILAPVDASHQTTREPFGAHEREIEIAALGVAGDLTLRAI